MAKLNTAIHRSRRFTAATQGMYEDGDNFLGAAQLSPAHLISCVFDCDVLFDSNQRARQRQRQRNKQRVNDNPVNLDGQPNQEEVA